LTKKVPTILTNTKKAINKCIRKKVKLLKGDCCAPVIYTLHACCYCSFNVYMSYEASATISTTKSGDEQYQRTSALNDLSLV